MSTHSADLTTEQPTNMLDSDTEADDATQKRGPGRPPYYPPWLKPAAQLVANGYTLRKALRRLGVTIPDAQLRQVYRWRLFREFYEEARRVFVADWGSTPGRKVEAFTRSVLGDWSVAYLNEKDAS